MIVAGGRSRCKQSDGPVWLRWKLIRPWLNANSFDKSFRKASIVRRRPSDYRRPWRLSKPSRSACRGCQQSDGPRLTAVGCDAAWIAANGLNKASQRLLRSDGDRQTVMVPFPTLAIPHNHPYYVPLSNLSFLCETYASCAFMCFPKNKTAFPLSGKAVFILS